MELKKLLGLENPTLDELEQTEKLLQKAVDDASKKLADLAAEDRSQAVSRLRGIDTGAEARQAARVKAEGDRSDAAAVLASTQRKISDARAEIAKDAEAKAWTEVRGHLERRRAAMAEIQKLSDKLADLTAQVVREYHEAGRAAPRKPEQRASLTTGHIPGQVQVAIIAYIHAMLGHPLSALHLEPAHLTAYEMAMRPDGLVSYLKPTDDLILSAEGVAGEARVEAVPPDAVVDEAA